MSSDGIFRKLKSLTKESLIYGLAHIVTRSVTFLLLPYYSYRLSAADYGELSLYYLFVAVVQTFYVYGLDVSYLRFYNLSDHGRTREQVNGTILLAITGTALVLTLALALAKDGLASLLIHESADYAAVSFNILLCLGVLFFDTVSTFPFLWLRSNNRPLVFSGQKLINVTANIGLNVLLVGYLELGVRGVIYANLIASAVTTLIVLPGYLRACQFTFDKPLFRDLLRFGLPNVPTYLFVMVVELAARKILEIFKGAEIAGLYSAGYKLGMFMGVVNAAFRFAWQPFFLKHVEDENAPALFSRTLTYYLFVACSLLVLLTLFVPPILMTDLPFVGKIISEDYWEGLAIFPIILAAHIFDGVYANLMVGVYLKKATRKLPGVTGAAALFTVVANLLLIPAFGMFAAAWVSFLAFLLQAVLLYFVVRRIYPIRYEWGRVFFLGLITTLFTTGAALWKPGFLLSAGIAMMFFAALLVSGFFRRDELALARRKLGL